MAAGESVVGRCLGCNMGIAGAAIATVIGQWVGAAVALGLNAASNHEVRLTFKGFRMSRATVWSVYKVGLPTILTQAMGAVMLFSMNGILGALLPGLTIAGTAASAPAIAFFGAYNKLQNFLYMPIHGLGQATIPIVGFNYGAKNGERVKRVLKTAIPVAAVVGTVLFEAIPGPLLRIFSASEEALAIGVPGLRIIAVTFVLGYACSGLGNGIVNMVGSCLRQFIPLVPLAFLFGKLGGVDTIWYAMWISEALAVLYAIFSNRRIYRAKVTPLAGIPESQ